MQKRILLHIFIQAHWLIVYHAAFKHGTKFVLEMTSILLWQGPGNLLGKSLIFQAGMDIHILVASHKDQPRWKGDWEIWTMCPE